MAVNGLNYTIGNELKFTTNSIERGVVTSGGTWGFGTLSPNSIVHISGATDPLTITGLGSKSEANILTIDGSGVVGTRNDVFVSATISDNDITLSDSNSGDTTLSVSAITEVTYSDWGLAGSAFNVSAPAVELPFITGGTYNGTPGQAGQLVLEVNGDSSESNITITGFSGSDTFSTGGTFSNGTLTIGLNDGSDYNVTGLWTDIPNSALINPGIVLGSTTIELGDTVGTIAGMTSITSTDFIGNLTGNADTADAWSSSMTLTLGTDLTGNVSFDGSNGVTLDATIANDAVTTVKILDGNVTNAKLANDSVTLGSTEVDLGTTVTEIAGLTSVSATTFTGALVGNASSATVLETGRDFSISGDITANAISFDGSGNVALSATIDNDAVTTDKILNGAVTNAKLENSGFLTSGTSASGGSIVLGDSIVFKSTDGSVSIADNGSGEFDIEVVDSVDTKITGGTYTDATGTLVLRDNDDNNITIDGKWNHLESASIVDNVIEFTSNTGETSSVTVKAMTGGTFDLASGVITAEGSDNPSNISLGTDFVTGVTESNNVISFIKNGGTSAVVGTIDAVTGVTYNTDWDIALAGTGTIGTTPVELPFITGGTYSNGTLTLVTNDGLETIAGITGFKTDDTYLTGVTVGAGTGSVDFELNDAGEDFTASGFNFVTSGDSGTSTINLQGSLEIVGLDGITTSDNGSGQISIDLDDTAVTPNPYGAADTVATFTVDAQGRLTAAGSETIDIVASQVSDFATSAKTAVFQGANFEDTTGASGIDFTVVAGDKVSAVLANASTTFAGTTGSNPEIDLGQTLTFISSDSSVIISGNSGTLDIVVSDTGIQNIYTEDGTLEEARTVSQAGNTLSFVGGDFTVDETTFVVDETASAVAIGASAPAASAVLEVASTTKGFLFPRMTESQRNTLTASAVQGLMVYQTDGDEGIYIYKSFGWVQVI